MPVLSAPPSGAMIRVMRKGCAIPENVLKAWLVAVLGAVLGLSGCAASSINTANPLISDQPDLLVAKVYIIRPRTERYLGMADNSIAVELDRRPLMQLAKGEYTLLHLHPGSAWLGLRSMTTWGPGHKIKEMSTTREFTFDPGETYYIAIHPIDGEFRGVKYEAELVDHDSAVRLTRYLNAFGKARREPIRAL